VWIFRVEILKQHAIDMVDVLDEDGKKRKNTADKGILSGIGNSGAFELFNVIKEGVTGADDKDDKDGRTGTSKRRQSIKRCVCMCDA
jgi:hypothetical protein